MTDEDVKMHVKEQLENLMEGIRRYVSDCLDNITDIYNSRTDSLNDAVASLRDEVFQLTSMVKSVQQVINKSHLQRDVWSEITQ